MYLFSNLVTTTIHAKICSHYSSEYDLAKITDKLTLNPSVLKSLNFIGAVNSWPKVEFE